MEVKNLKAGEYTVVWTNVDHDTLTAEIRVSSSGVTCISGPCGSALAPGVQIKGLWGVFGILTSAVAPPPPPAKGYISVSSTPTAAKVDVNGTDIGVTPVTRYELSTGSKLVTLRLSGYKPEERGVTIVDGETASLSVPLTPLSPEEEGFLNVTSTPSGASVSIAGVSIGSTPISSYGLPAGAKVVTISLTGYETATKDVTIVAGETSTVDVALVEAVVPTTIGGWIDQVGVTALTREHALYIHYHVMGASGAAAAIYDTLVPKPSEIDPLLATRENALGIYYYTIGAMGAGNALTGCSY